MSGRRGDGHRPDPALRERLLEAAYDSVARYGLAKTTVEDVVKQSGVSRATVYRVFPGGKDELLRAAVGWEMGRFFGRLAEAVAGAADFASLVESGLVFAHVAVHQHEVLQKVLVTEPERLLPLLTTEQEAPLAFITAFLLPYLEREQRAGRVARRRRPRRVGRVRRPHDPVARRVARATGTSTTRPRSGSSCAPSCSPACSRRTPSRPSGRPRCATESVATGRGHCGGGFADLDAARSPCAERDLRHIDHETLIALMSQVHARDDDRPARARRPTSSRRGSSTPR